MKKKIIYGTIGILAILLVILVVYSAKMVNNTPKADAEPLIVSVDKIVENPGHFKDYVGVTGKVVKVDDPKASFALGCEDACIAMPIEYKGRVPEQGSEIIAYGKIKEAGEGKYIFEVQEIKTKT